MEKTLCIIVLLVVVGSVIAEDDELACCPSSSLLYKATRHRMVCYDPMKNITASPRLTCDTFIAVHNFSVKSGMIERQITDLYKETFGSDLACYGIYANTTDGPFSNLSLVCLEREERYIRQLRVMDYCIIVSIVALSLTTIIYAIFSELRDLFGKSVINYCGSFALAMAILGIDPTVMSYCALRGFAAYFFLVASFFWSNAISIQLLRDTRRPTSEDYSWKEFKWYMLYSWGSPTVLTAIMAIANYHPGYHPKPGAGDNCWFLNRDLEWYYLNSVVMTLFVINVGIFIYVATMLCRFAVKSTHMKTLKFKFSMTLRLIVLMGLPWLFKIINLVAEGTSFIWYMLEIISVLQGLLVFLVLVARKRVVKVLHRRGLLVCCAGPVERWLAAGEDETIDQPTAVFLREHKQTDESTHT